MNGMTAIGLSGTHAPKKRKNPQQQKFFELGKCQGSSIVTDKCHFKHLSSKRNPSLIPIDFHICADCH